MKIVGHVVFACDVDGTYPDVAGAAAALQAAGYVVARYPEELRYRLAACGDDFLEAVLDVGDAITTTAGDKNLNEINSATGSPAAKVRDGIDREIEAIARSFGGLCDQCDFEPAAYVPFADRFES